MKSTVRNIALAIHHFTHTVLRIVIAIFMLSLAFTFQKANAQTPYNPGKLAVLVVGDGSAAPSGSASPVFVKEFNTSGAAQSGTLRTSLPTVVNSGTGSVNRALTQSSSGTSEGHIGLSENRQLLVVTGYNVAVGTASVTTSSATTFPTNCRVVARIDATGVADTKTTLNTSYTGSAIRSATTVNGSGFWTAGTTGLNYVPNGNIAVATNLATTNTRIVSIFNNQLYTSTQSGAALRLATVGSGLPTSGTQTLTNLNGFLTSTGDPYSHVFLDLNGGGPDVLYVASLSAAPSGLLKYTSSNNGTTWSAAGSLTGNVFGVTGAFNPCTGDVDLYITANTTNAKPNSLYKFSDLDVTVGSPAVITNNGFALTTFGTLLATASANTAFGGVAFTPGTTLSASLFTVTGGNACFDSSVIIGLSNSETGINYELKKDGVTISALPGTGAPLIFGSRSDAGVYTITATNILTGCTTNMAGSSIINSLPLVSFSGLASQYCISLTEVTLTGSPAGGIFSGPGITGNVFDPSTAGIGGPYNITYSFTNTETGCSNAYTQQVTVNAIPSATFGASPNSICSGGSSNLVINFTGTAPWTFSIDGAAPVTTSSNPETIPVSPSVTKTYELTALSDANCNASAWISVAAGSSHVLGVKYDGTLWSWGYNLVGQLGIGNNTNANQPVRVGTSTDWAAVSAGDAHSMAIKKNGTLWVWGDNSTGQVANGTFTGTYNTPQQVGSASNWVKADAGNSYCMALKSDGTLWGWGSNVNGYLGDGTNTGRNIPVQAGTDTDWKDVSAGLNHTLGLKSNGTLWAWGLGSVGQLGGATPGNSPSQVGLESNWGSICAGEYNSLAIKKTGSLWGWGWNQWGELGRGNYIQTNVPAQVGTANNWQSVSLYSRHSIAVKQDGTLWSWGVNIAGALGNGTTSSSNAPAQAGAASNWLKVTTGPGFSLGISSDHTLWAWGNNIDGQLGDGTNVNSLSPLQVNAPITSVTVTVTNLPVVSFTGLSPVYCSNATASLLTGIPAGGSFSGPGISGNLFDPAIAGAGGPYSITYTYTDIATGCSNSNSQIVNVTALQVVSFTGLASQYCISASPVTLTGIPAGGTFSGPGISGNVFDPALAGNGGPYTITYAYTDMVTGCTNTISQSVSINAIPTGTISASPNQICNGSSANLTLNFTGTGPWTYSINGAAPVSTLNNQETVSVNPSFTTIFELTALSDANCNASDWISVSAGSYHVLGIKSDGSLWSWGLNGDGQLGRGNTADTSRPVRIGNSNDWAMVSAGAIHSMALKNNGTLWTWGSNGFGRLGLGTSTGIQITPQQVDVATDWFKIEAGNISSMALKSDGTLWGWGNNGFGILGDGTNAQRNSPVQVGTDTDWAEISSGISHTLALKTNGTLWGWGSGGVGQLGGAIPGNFPQQMGSQSDWSSVIAGNNNSMAIKTTGTLWGWGWNQLGELGLENYSQTNSPTQVGTASNWKELSFFTAHSHALKQTGTLWSWGSNQNGSFGTGNSSSSNIPVQAGSATNWLKVSAGLRFGLGIRSDRTLWAWGINSYGQLGNGTFTDTLSPVQVHSPISSVTITVIPLPEVSFTGLSPAYCANLQPVTLTGSPAGGTFSGPGMSGNVFDPGMAGAGIHMITYTFGDFYGCQNSSSQTVNVKPIPDIPVITGNFCQGYTLSASPSDSLASLAWNLNGTTISTTIASAGSIPMIVAGGNGSGSTANRLNDPTGVYVDKLGNIYIADNNNHRIQKWVPGATSGVTVAGGNGQGSAANQLNTPFGVTVDVSGNIFVADTYNHRIQKWAPGATSGVTVAGGNAAGSGMDQLNEPTGVFIDNSGNIFIADIVNHRIQKWLPGSIAGITVAGGNGQGSAMNQLDYPGGIFVDDSGNIFIADQRNHRIQKWATGALSGVTVAGGNGIGASAATLNYPAGVFVDQAGMIYIADRFNNRVQKWVPGATSGITIAGGFGSGVSVYHLIAPFGVFVDGNGNVFVTDSNDRIMKRSQVVNNQYNTQSSGAYTVTATGFNGCNVSSLPVIVNPLPAVSFSGLPAYCCTTAPAVTLTGSPAGGTFSGWGINGNIFDPAVSGPGTHYINYTFTDLNGCTNTKIQVVTINYPAEIYSENMCAGKNLTAFPTNGVSSMIWYLNGSPVTTVTATGVANGNTVAGGNGPGAGADELSSPYGVSLDISGNVYVADVENHRVQKWSPGALTGVTVAGGNGDGSGPGQFSYPYALYVDVDGNVYVADLYNFRIQKWAPGAISGVTVAGGNGQGSAANQIGSPYGVVVDGTGNIYIADPENYRIQKWGPGATSGTTAAGGNGNGSASNQLSNPTGLCLDAAGNIYIADALNNRIQKWVPGATSGITVAGGNGPGAAANQLNYPNAVSVDNSGNIYVTDNGNNRIQKWAPGASSGITVAGGNGAGSGTNQLDNPYGLSLDGGGNMFIADITNHRIQQWQQTIFDSLPNPVAGVYTVSVTSFSGCNSTSASFTVNPLPQISFSGLSATYCVNDHKVTLTGNPSGGTFSGPGISGNEFDPASAGSGGPYIITYSYSDPETGCSNTYTQNVTVFGLPTISVTASHTLVCSGSPVTLGASGALTYSWMPGGLTGSSIIVNPESTTTYTVTGTDANGCSTSPGWMDVSGGLYHSLGVKKDGSLWAWGYNLYGQLGIDDYSNKNIPVQIGAATNWKKVSGGGLFSVGIRSDGTLWAWGDNSTGQLGDGTNMSQYVPVQVGSSTDWKEISAGDYHCLAIKTNGTLWAWGDNSTGQLGDGTNMTKYVPVQIGSATNWSKVSSGQLHSIALKSDGTLWSWGSNEFGQLGDGSLSDKNIPVQIGSSTEWANMSAGASHNTGIKTDGTLWAWGWNYFGQLGNGNNTDSNVPVQIGTSADWKITSGGANESAAKKSDGTLWAWGSNISGQLGNGTNNDINIPVQVGTETNWSAISGGYAHSLGIKSDGNLWTWGDNWAGQLGDRTNTSVSIPNQIGSSSVSISITVNPLPVVSFSGLPSNYCASDTVLTLTDIPSGGTFSGPGISGISFDPAAAGAGTHSITYSYTDGNGCSNSETKQVVVSICTPAYTTLNLTAFLEGFYYDINTMRANIYDLGISTDPAETDTVTVNLWAPASLSNAEPDHTVKSVLHTDGTATMQFPSALIGNQFYIAVKHRNHLETWSKLPVTFSSNTDYDFTDNLQKAYDDGVNPPMSAVAGNKFAFYGGEVNQDGTVDASDMADVDNDNAVFAFGYNATDASGDGTTDASDISIVDNNQALFLFYARPY